MSDNKEFKWTDELVKESVCYWMEHNADHSLDDSIEKFKLSKQPKEDYTILSFRGKEFNFGYGKMFNLVSDDIYLDVKSDMNVSLHSLLNNGLCVKTGEIEIFTVQRNTDMEVFSLGDDFQLGMLYAKKDSPAEHYKGKIKWFEIIDNKIRVHDKETWFYLESISKVKPKVPLFTTEDGVEVFSGDKVYSIRKVDWYNSDDTFEAHAGSMSLGVNRYRNVWWYFSTKDAKNNFILENKPIHVSYKEIEAYYLKEHDNYPAAILKDFFKSKQ